MVKVDPQVWTNFCSQSAPGGSIWNLVTITQWLLRRCLKMSKYERHGSKVKEWPWLLVLSNIHVLIKMTVYAPMFSPKASTISMKSIVLAFSPYKSYRKQIWPCCKKKSRSTQGHSLNNHSSTYVPDATYQVSRPSVYWFWRRRFFKFFTIYRRGGYVGHVTRTIWTTLRSPISRGSTWNLVTIGPVVSEKNSFENVDGWTTVGRQTTEPVYPIRSPGATGSGELKRYSVCLSRFTNWKS